MPHRSLCLLLPLLLAVPFCVCAEQPTEFLSKHCFECHNADVHEGGLDLSLLKVDLSQPDNFARWVKIHDRIQAGEMPPRDQPRPPLADQDAVTKLLKRLLIDAEQSRLAGQPRTGIRRLTRRRV